MRRLAYPVALAPLPFLRTRKILSRGWRVMELELELGTDTIPNWKVGQLQKYRYTIEVNKLSLGVGQIYEHKLTQTCATGGSRRGHRLIAREGLTTETDSLGRWQTCRGANQGVANGGKRNERRG
jgi:hypothetical protein